MVDLDVRKAMEEIEAEEAKALKEAEAAASRARARELVPITNAPFTDDEGRHPAACAARDCDALATNPNGSLRLVPDRKWWCDSHCHLAGEHDHLPPVPTYIPGPNPGSMRLNPESEEGKRVKAKAERERREREERESAEKAKAEAIAEVQERYRREAVINVAGIRMHPDGRIVQR